MPQPQPDTPDVMRVMRIIGRCLTVIGVISVLLIFLGLACKMAQIVMLSPGTKIEVHLAADLVCTGILWIGVLGLFVAFVLKVIERLIVQFIVQFNVQK